MAKRIYLDVLQYVHDHQSDEGPVNRKPLLKAALMRRHHYPEQLLDQSIEALVKSGFLHQTNHGSILMTEAAKQFLYTHNQSALLISLPERFLAVANKYMVFISLVSIAFNIYRYL